MCAPECGFADLMQERSIPFTTCHSSIKRQYSPRLRHDSIWFDGCTDVHLVCAWNIEVWCLTTPIDGVKVVEKPGACHT